MELAASLILVNVFIVCLKRASLLYSCGRVIKLCIVEEVCTCVIHSLGPINHAAYEGPLFLKSVRRPNEQTPSPTLCKVFTQTNILPNPQNFLALCASDYYNNSLFHRNIKGFMVQVSIL